MNKDKLQKITNAIQGEIDAFGEVMDVSKFRNLQKKLEKYLTTDAVTGIFNRWKIEEAVESEIKIAQSNKSKLCLMMIDVDKFKTINDTQGHNAGDSLLAEVAYEIEYALEKTMGQSKRFGRWGGDEFVYVCPSRSVKGTKKLVQKVFLNLKDNIYHGKFVHPITVSIGMAWLKKDDDVTSLVARADKAMYEVKKRGGNGVATIK